MWRGSDGRVAATERRRLVRPGALLGVIAVVLALTGSAVAASKITGAQIKDGTITGKDLKNGSIGPSKLSDGSYETLQGPAGPAGAPGPQGPPGPVAIAKLTRVTATATLAAGAVSGITAYCPAGQDVVSGGYTSVSGDGEVFAQDSFGSPNSWSAALDNFYSLVSGQVTAVAYCVPSGSAVTASAKHVQPAGLTKAVEQRRRAHRG
jgi:hypothetical protein